MWPCFLQYAIDRDIFTLLTLSFISVKWFCNSLSLSPENSDLYLFYFAEFVCCEVLDSNTCLIFLKMYFSSPQLFVFLFDVLSVAVFVIRDRYICKKADLCLNLYPCVIKYYLILSLSLSLSLSPENSDLNLSYFAVCILGSFRW